MGTAVWTGRPLEFRCQCPGQAERVHLGVDLPEHREPTPPVLVWDTSSTAHHSLCVSTSDPCMPFPIQETR